jgi:hypothetical protein
MMHLLIPYHGSKYNMNSDMMSYVAKPSHWVASFRLGDQHHHPNFGVISNFVAGGNNLSLCDEWN